MTCVTMPKNTISRILAQAIVPVAIAMSFSLVGLAATILPAGAQDLGAQTISAGLPGVTELITGQDKTGPYPLRWKKIPAATVTYKPVVIVDGQQIMDASYTLDLDNGTITFALPLKSTSMAQIQYCYDPAVSQRNAAAASAPVTVPMVSSGGSSLQLTALPSDLTSAPHAGMQSDPQMILRLSGAPMSLFGGGLTTQALIAPGAHMDGISQGGALDQTGLTVGYKLGNDKDGVDAGYSRTGRGFAPSVGKALQLGDTAQQIQSLAARYSLTQWMRADWKQTDTNVLATNSSRDQLEQMALHLGGSAGLPAVNLTEINDDKTDNTGLTTKQLTDKLDLNAKLAPTIGLTGAAQQGLTQPPSGAPSNATTDINLNLQAQTKSKKEGATVVVTDSSQASAGNDQQKSGVALTVQASPTLSFTAGETDNSTKASAAAGGAYTAAASQSAGAKIALAPGASLTGGLSVNSVKDTANSIDGKVQATSIGAQVGTGKAIELQQTMVTRDGGIAGPATLDTTDTRVALRPVAGMTLTGQLTNNPEANGQVTQARQEQMNFAAKVGGLQVGSGYSLTASAAQQGLKTGQLSVTLGLRVNRYTQVSGAYKDALLYGVTESTETVDRGSESYSLGLTHDIGSLLNFTLGGSMVYNRNPAATVPCDYQAQAKLGVTF